MPLPIILAPLVSLLAQKGLTALSSAVLGSADKALELVEKKTGIKLTDDKGAPVKDIPAKQVEKLAQFETTEGIELENIFNLRNIPDSDRIKDCIDRRKPGSAVVVGAGFIGLEMAENLLERGVKTTIIEMLNQVMSPLDYEMATVVHAHLKENDIDCRLECGVTAFSRDGDRIWSRRTGERIFFATWSFCP